MELANTMDGVPINERSFNALGCDPYAIVPARISARRRVDALQFLR